MLGGTYGGDEGPHGAGYSAITYRFTGTSGGEPTGEIELHEWLHQVDWMFAHVQGWPDEFFPTPDSGRMAETLLDGGDPCQPRRTKAESDWFPFLRHLIQEHATDRMWRSASMHVAAPNAFSAGDVRLWRVSAAQPFTGARLDALRTKLSLDPARSKVFATAADRALRLHEVRPGTEGQFVAAVQVWAYVPTETPVLLKLGSDDGCRVLVNKDVVHETTEPRPLTVDQDSVPARFKRGWNRIRITVENVGGPWGVSLRIENMDGVPPRGLLLAVDPPPTLD
jgi:hypothetical protein